MTIRGIHRQLALGACAALLIVAAVACGDDDDDANGSPNGNGGDANGTGAAQEATVNVADNSFTPARVTIASGGTVTWDWSGEFPHSVVGTFDGAAVESETMTGEGSFSFTFEEAGTFSYQCGVHGESMAGTVVIEA